MPRLQRPWAATQPSRDTLLRFCQAPALGTLWTYQGLNSYGFCDEITPSVQGLRPRVPQDCESTCGSRLASSSSSMCAQRSIAFGELDGQACGVVAVTATGTCVVYRCSRLNSSSGDHLRAAAPVRMDSVALLPCACMAKHDPMLWLGLLQTAIACLCMQAATRITTIRGNGPPKNQPPLT